MNNRKRKHPVQIYLSDDEYTLLSEKTKLSGLKSISAFIRYQIIYGFTYDIDYSELRDYNFQLHQIGKNLNQIAHVANASGTIDNKDLHRAKELMEQIWRTQKSMLSNQPLMHQ